MNNKKNNKPMDKKSMVIMWVIIAAIMVYAVASDGEATIPAVGTLIITTVILLITGAANKKTAAKPAQTRTAAQPEPVKTPSMRTEAARLRARRSFWICVTIVAVVFLVILPKELLRETLSLIDHFGLQRAVHVLWRSQRGQLYGLLIFATLALAAVIGLLRIPALTRRIARLPDNIPANRPAAAVRAPATEDAITCAHHTGKEKYLEQLESHLKAGLIDKDEYRVLKERYSKLDIPDDYH